MIYITTSVIVSGMREVEDFSGCIVITQTVKFKETVFDKEENKYCDLNICLVS